jgi:hypothetical protein
MLIAFLIVVFLEACLIALRFRIHTKIVYNITKTFDSRERELLDRLMYVTNKPWNMPPRVDSSEASAKSVDNADEIAKQLQNWEDF